MIESILATAEALEAFYANAIKHAESRISHLEEEVEYYESLVDWTIEADTDLSSDHYPVDPETIDDYRMQIEGLREEISVDQTIHADLVEAVAVIRKLMELPFSGEQIDNQALWILNTAMRGKGAITKRFHRYGF